MSSARERLIDQAIEAIHNGLSQRSASKQYGIAQSTLSKRIRGTTSKRNSKISTQRLSPAQEGFICKWILNEEKAGRAPNRRQVAGFAMSILKRGGDNDKLGARWVDRFMKRNPSIRTKISSPLESDDDALPAQPSPPRTPPNEGVSKDNIIFPTPQKSRDMLEGIHNKLSALDREIRTVVTKAAKSLDVKKAELAAKDHQIQYLQTHLASHKPRGKIKVKEGGNDKFARIDEIIKAREASKEAPKRQKVARETTAVNPVQAVERALESALEVIYVHQNE